MAPPMPIAEPLSIPTAWLQFLRGSSTRWRV